MSWKATAFVKEILDGITQTEKFVLLLLADYHNTVKSVAWPSVPVLAQEALMSERNATRVLASLEEKGFIRRARGEQPHDTTAYEICGLETKPRQSGQNVHPETATGMTVGMTSGWTNSNRNKEEPVIEPVIERGEAPPDLHPLQLARGMVNAICEYGYALVEDPQTLRMIAGAIEAEEKSGKSRESAYSYILACTLDRVDRHEKINAFTFKDGDYKPNGGTKARTGETVANTRSQRSIDSLRRASQRFTAQATARD